MDDESRKFSKRGRSLLQRMEDRKLATPDAIHSMLNLVDPFPDTSFVPRGWPSNGASNSVKLTDNVEYTVGAPPGLAPGATWDLHVCNLPFGQASLAGTGGTYSMPASGVLTTVPNPRAAATFSILTYPSGAAQDVFTPPIATTTRTQWSSDTILDGEPFRITAMGAELINTSAELYRGGMGYAYRLPNDVEPVVHYTNAAVQTLKQQAMMSKPPTSQLDVTNFPNTTKLTAESGVVFINTPVDSLNKIVRPSPSTVFFNDWASTGGALNTSVYTEGLCPPSNWNVAGSFITGLAQGASITIRIRVAYELFPGWKNRTLAAMCTAPVPHSPQLEEILDRVLAEMPAGFDYRENPFGEWFDSVLGAIAELAPKVGSVVGTMFPGAGLLGSAIGSGAQAVRLMRSKAPAERVYDKPLPPLPTHRNRNKPLPPIPSSSASKSNQRNSQKPLPRVTGNHK